MLVLSGKKLKNIVIGLFAVFMVVALTLGSKENNLNYIDTVSLPVSGKVVVIDAGHGDMVFQMRGQKLEMEQQKHKLI